MFLQLREKESYLLFLAKTKRRARVFPLFFELVVRLGELRDGLGLRKSFSS